MSDVKIVVTIDDKRYEDSTDGVNKANDRMKNNTKKNVSAMRLAFASFAGFIARDLVNGAFRLLGKGIRTTISAFQDFTKASGIQEDSVNALNTSLASTGQLSIAASEDLQAYSAAMEATTRFGDEAINTQLAFAISMGSSTSEAKELVTAATNLSAVTGQALKTSVEQLNRSMSGQASRLKNMVPILSDLTREELQAGGAIKLLNEEFAGRAQSDAETYSGKLDMLTNAIGTVKELFGDIITQSPVIRTALDKGIEGFVRFAGFITENMPLISKIVNRFVVSTATFVVKWGQTFVDVFFKIKRNIEDFKIAWDLAVVVVGGHLNKLGISFKVFFASIKSLAKIASGEMIDFMTFAIRKIDQQQARLTGKRFLPDEFMNVAEENARFEKEVAKLQEEADKIDKIEEKRTQKAIEEANKRILNNRRERDETDKVLDEIKAISNSFVEELAIANASEPGKKEEEETPVIQPEVNTDKPKKETDGFFDHMKKGFTDYKKWEDQTGEERVKNFSDTMGSLTNLQRSGNKELAMVGKAAAIGQATMDGILAVQKALSSAPPPFNFALAGIVGAATAANVSQIASQPIGFATGGVPAGGNLLPGDNNVAMIQRKERVLTASQNQNFEALTYNNNQIIPQMLSNINDTLNNKDFGGNIAMDGVELTSEIDKIKNRRLRSE